MKVRLLKYRDSCITTAECSYYELTIERSSWFGLKKQLYTIMHAQPFVHTSLKDVFDRWDKAIKYRSLIKLNSKDYIFIKIKP